MRRMGPRSALKALLVSGRRKERPEDLRVAGRDFIATPGAPEKARTTPKGKKSPGIKRRQAAAIEASARTRQGRLDEERLQRSPMRPVTSEYDGSSGDDELGATGATHAHAARPVTESVPRSAEAQASAETQVDSPTPAEARSTPSRRRRGRRKGKEAADGRANMVLDSSSDGEVQAVELHERHTRGRRGQGPPEATTGSAATGRRYRYTISANARPPAHYWAAVAPGTGQARKSGATAGCTLRPDPGGRASIGNSCRPRGRDGDHN